MVACALLNARFAFVTAKFATVTKEKADEDTLFALDDAREIVEEAEVCADLIPFEAEIDAC